MLAFSSRKNKRGGGSTHQSLDYVNPDASLPNASAGSNLLYSDGRIIRPTIGGFVPSVMKGVVNGAAIVGPLAAMAAKRMFNNKTRKGGGKKENWAKNRENAKGELSVHGKPSATNINKYAALKRKSATNAETFLNEYIQKKQTKKVKQTKRTKKETKKVNWKTLVNQAKNELSKYGKPSAINTRKLASMKKEHKKENIKIFLRNYKTKKARKPEPVFRSRAQRGLNEARQYLSQYGKPSNSNVKQYLQAIKKGQNTKALLKTIRSHMPKK